MKFEMKHRYTGSVLFTIETNSLKLAVEAAVKGGADLSWANLSGANLSGAHLSGADLRWANLSWANLSWANLRWANLSWANLRWANLSGAHLSWANLSGAHLRWANLSGAHLSWADLRWANLSGAHLSWANLDKTVLDPTNQPNGMVDGFMPVPDQPGWVYGYRTRATSAAGLHLQNDRIYGTEVFSTDDTECHPGWYLWPTLNQSEDFSRQDPYIQVRARIIDIHKAGSKWRSRAIWVIGEAQS